jgi:hypothetical protein
MESIKFISNGLPWSLPNSSKEKRKKGIDGLCRLKEVTKAKTLGKYALSADVNTAVFFIL